MGLKTLTIDFAELSIDPKVGLKDYSCLYKTGIRLKWFLLNQNIQTDIKSGRTPSKFNKDYWNGKNEFLTMSDVDTLTFSINTECTNKITDYAVEEEKTLYQAKQNSLIVSNAMTVGLSFLLDRPVFINQNVFEVILDENKINKKFVLWYLNLIIRPLFKKTYTSKYLSKDELGRIKIPFIPKAKQDQVIAQIKPIERKIKGLKAQIKQPQGVINKVFAKEFCFDENLYNEFGKGMTAGTQSAQNRKVRVFKTDFKEFARNGRVRFSTRFHNPPTKKLMDFLDRIKTLQVKDIVESYEKGIQPQYNPDGEIPVVKIASLKNGYIEFSESEFITQEYYNKANDNKKLKKNDIIICATGKISLGKIDFYDYENKSITTVDNYILRLNENYKTLFFTYFFRSILGYFQIERDFTGATNQIHLYWEQISNFLIPDISLKNQEKIVDEIKEELDKQKEVKEKIEIERNKIDEIIKKSIK